MIKPPVSVTLELKDEGEAERLMGFYSKWQAPSPKDCIVFFARGERFVLSVYAPKNGVSKALFQGPNAPLEAKRWKADYEEAPLDVKNRRRLVAFPSCFPQIGSDEVGTGDFFGPISVAAAYVEEKDVPFLKDLGVTDSKLLDDERILSIGPTLIKRFEYSQMSLPNAKYNKIHDSCNMNAIKAKMHNACLGNLVEKHPDAYRYQDQFAERSLYYGYLKGEKNIVTGIVFKTKGELSYLSVALASVIARYSFLLKMRALNEKYGLVFPFGAAKKVDEFAAAFVKRYGANELKEVAKLNFANAKRLLG